jgi:SAM-dependent methyltransferase
MEVLPTATPRQFNIQRHYDVMAQLDQDVHGDELLAASEVNVALRLIDSVPRRVFLPCCGTGRHVAALLAAGVQQIVGVDLSPVCVAKGQARWSSDPRVSFYATDVREYRFCEQFDAMLLLGNSFGDIIDHQLAREVTAAMVAPVRPHGQVVMDYIGEHYAHRYGQTTIWEAVLDGCPVWDHRCPEYDPLTGVMTIRVWVKEKASGRLQWKGYYQKMVLSNEEIVRHFTLSGVVLQPHGLATSLNPYYQKQEGELGMIANSTWWAGRKQ